MRRKNYIPFGQFIIRTPLYPYNARVSPDQYVNTNIFNEALFLASPEFVEQKISKGDNKGDSRMAESLYKYFSRSFSRCTPFGLFAGCSVGELGSDLNIHLKPLEQYTRCTRLDMNYVCALIQYLEQQPEIQNQLTYYPNDSIYELGGQIRYVEYFYKGINRIHQITSIEKTEYLCKLLEVGESGATIHTLANSITDDDISYEEAYEFVKEVISSQILKSQLEAQTTGEDPLSRLITELEHLNNIAILPILKQISKMLGNIDQAELGKSVKHYEYIIELIKKIGVSYELKFLFQTDMYKPVSIATLPEHFVLEFNHLLNFLNGLTVLNSDTTLNHFKDAFYNRYEEQEVPLSGVMDKELGIGYPPNLHNGDISRIIDDLIMPQTNSSPNSIQFSAIDDILLTKYFIALKNGSKEILLQDSDFPKHNTDWSDTPNTLNVMCSIVKDRHSSEFKIIVKSIGGSSAANLLGRFCHIDQQIHSLVKQITEKERELSGDVIIAEIAHLPESRIGNIAMRPILRDYEIHYLSHSGVPLERRIPVSDILVSVRQNRIVLRSKRLNKEIIPRLTNAHNYSFNSMPIYHFLCDMQTQGLRAGFDLNWQGIFDRFTYLPRLQYKNYILSVQRWNINKSEIKDWGKLDDSKLLTQVHSLRKKYGIPKEIVIPEGDNELYVDLENIISIRTMLSRIKNYHRLSFKEFILSDFDTPVTDSKGVFCNEFIIPFYKNTMFNPAE